MRIFVITKRTLIIWILILALVITGIILLLSFTPNAAAVSSSAMVEAYEMEVLAGRHKEVPVYSVDRADKKIALTIDAAWEDDKTPFILDTLAQYNVKATFFLCGFWVEKYPEEVKQIAAAGHEIGNHTATHPHMNQLDEQQARDYQMPLARDSGAAQAYLLAPAEKIRNHPRQTGAESYDSFAVSTKHLIIHSWFIIKALCKAFGNNLYQVLISLIIFRQQHKMVITAVIFRPFCRLTVEPGSRCHIHLTSKDGIYPLCQGRLVKFYGSIHNAMIRNSQAVHTKFFGTVY